MADVAGKVRAALLGLACGDALGAPAEFKDKAYIQTKWGRLTEMVGGGAWLPGEWTDDTGMTLCVAEGILANPNDPIAETGQRFLEWRKTAKDVGSTISAALSAFQGDWPAAAQSIPQVKQGKAAGNGSLMRTLPVALAYGPHKQLMLTMSARLSAMTHWDSQAEACCAVYCLWINNLLDGQSLQDGWRQALQEGRAVAARSAATPQTPGGASSLNTPLWQRLQAVESLTYSQLQPSGYAGYVVECLEAAAWCCLHAPSLEDALVQAVNLAGEADTIAAVAGGVAGAYWGGQPLPQRWLDRLYRRDDLERTADKLATLRRHYQVYATPALPAFEFNTVTDRILAGRNPLTARDIESLTEAGVTHILDLREPQEWAPPRFGSEAREEIERRHLGWLNVVVVDRAAPTATALDQACHFLDTALQAPGQRVYVHCRAGQERTGAVLVAYYARRHGVSYEAALATLRQARPALRVLPAQERAVREWLAQGESGKTK